MSVFNERILEVKANNFRNDHGIDLDTAIDFNKLLLSLNIITFFTKLSDDFSGVAYKASKSNRFMMINTSQQLGRQHFTIGHELYHLCVQENFSFQMCKTGLFNKKEREEYNADTFSSYLLMPEAGILKLIPENEMSWGGRLSIATILKLEQYFGVSRRAILIRLEKLGLLKAGDFDSYAVGVKKSAKENGYSLDLYEASDDELILGDYGVKAKQLFDVSKISESHYHSLMKDISIDIDKIEEDEQEE